MRVGKACMLIISLKFMRIYLSDGRTSKKDMIRELTAECFFF